MDVTYMSFLNSIYFLTFCFLCVSSDDTNLGKCADPLCSVPIGLGLTSLKYASPDGNRLSFNPNENVEIYVKDVGPKKDLWGVMLNGEKGYISKGFIKETKSFVKKLVSAEVDFKNLHISDSSSAVTGQAHSNKETQSMYGTQLKASVNDFSLHTSGNSYSSDFSSVQNNFNTAPESLSSDMDTDMDFFIESEDETVAGNNFPSSSHVHFTSNNILPSSSSHRPNIKQTAFHSQDILQSPYLQNTYDSESLQYDRSILQNEDSFYNSDIQSNTFFSSHIASENINPDSSKISDTVQYSQQKTEFFDPEQISYDSPESTWSDSDLSETLSILKNRGVYDSDIYAEQYSESVSSYPSQNVHADQQSKHADFNYVKPLSSHVLHATVTEQQIKTHLPLHDPSDIQPSEMNYGGESFSHIHSSLHENEFKSVSDKTLSSDNNVYKEKLSNVQNEIFQKNKQVKGALEKSRINKNVVSKNNKEINSKTERFSEEKTLKIEENLKPSEKLTVLKTSDIEILSSRNPQTDDTILNSIFEDSEEEEMTTIVIKPRKTSNPTYMAKTDIHVSQHIQKEDNQAEVKQIVESSMSQSDTDDIIIDDDSKEEVFLNSGIGSNLVVKHTSKSHLDHNVTVNNLDEEKSQEQYFEKSVYTSTVNEIAHNINGSVKTVYNEMPIDDIDSLTDSKDMHSDILIKTEDKDTLSDILIETEDKDTLSDILMETEDKDTLSDILMETEDKDTLSDILIETEDKDFISTESIDETKTENNETNFPIENDAEVNDVLTSPNLNGSDESPNSFQVRNLKGEHLAQEDQNSDSRVENEENVTQSEFNIYITFENGLNALRSLMEALMLWIPEPLYSAIMDLDRKGIPPRVTVFTALSAIPCIFLIIAMVYVKERSKEYKLSARLVIAEKNIFVLSAEKNVLQEKLETMKTEFSTLQITLEEEINSALKLKEELEQVKENLEETNSELEIKSEEIEELKQREKEYLSVLSGDEKEKADLLKEKDQMKKKIKDQDECISRLNDLLQENENEMDALRKENAEYLVAKEEYEEKLVVLQQNCNQLLQEAEVWNLRVNELTMQLNDENTAKKELEESFKAKEEEVESLKQLVQLSEILSGSEENENKDAEGVKLGEEKLQSLMNSASLLLKLKKQEEENELLSERLTLEKNKILDMEVEVLEAKSEIDKLKVSYNQALQDKAEAQTKLDVLTNYFKDKEIQLQKQLGVEEAVRQKKEEDASSAERRILLIEQENASYKYQVASMKQEMEETERNLKSQIAAQEKKAHENWIAARAAERKLEDVKQEVLQLRQRLTLLERDQENWVNSSRDNIIRPVPKRMPGLNDDLASSQEINSSLEMRPNLFPPPVPPPMLLPPDRPLPPLPPPPLPPFLPPLDPPFRPQPWHMPPPDTLSNSDFRVTPPEFSSRGRESTPPRGRRSAAVDGEMQPHASSPLGTDIRDSRNSTPPHSLPDFHDIPPQPPRPFFPPPAHHPRFSMPPPSFRRDPGPRRTDYQGNNSTQQPLVPQERWPHSNSRV